MKKPSIEFLICTITALQGCSTPSPIEMKIHSQKDRFNACHAKSPRAEGRVFVSFSFDQQGRITSSSIEQSTLNDPIWESCILSTLSTIKFDPHHESLPVTVEYPFYF